MRRVEYLRALNNNTWDTVIVDVPSINEDPNNGIDYDELCEADIRTELQDYSYTVLSHLDAHKDVVLFAIYNEEV